jgi:hypothetical protein
MQAGQIWQGRFHNCCSTSAMHQSLPERNQRCTSAPALVAQHPHDILKFQAIHGLCCQLGVEQAADAADRRAMKGYKRLWKVLSVLSKCGSCSRRTRAWSGAE